MLDPVPQFDVQGGIPWEDSLEGVGVLLGGIDESARLQPVAAPQPDGSRDLVELFAWRSPDEREGITSRSGDLALRQRRTVHMQGVFRER